MEKETLECSAGLSNKLSENHVAVTNSVDAPKTSLISANPSKIWEIRPQYAVYITCIKIRNSVCM